MTRKPTDWQPPKVFDTLRIARSLLPGRASYRLGALTRRGRQLVGSDTGDVPGDLRWARLSP
jgi:exodeoxyribonuclease X